MDKPLQSFWQLVFLQGKQDDEFGLIEKHFRETYARSKDGRYIVELPFKEEVITFGDMYLGAVTRFNSTECRLSRNPKLREDYMQFMREYYSLGHMRELSPDEIEVNNGRLFYLPHHPIIGPKLRVVFDVSFKDAHNNSLNNKLFT